MFTITHTIYVIIAVGITLAAIIFICKELIKKNNNDTDV